MGGSSSKTHFIWKKKKKSPLNKAWRQLKGALPNKKRKKKKLPRALDKLKLDNLKKKKHPQRKFSLPTDKKEFTSSKRVSLGNMRKESTTSLGRKEDRGGLGNVGEQIKKRLSLPM
ncbi:hypothetical protein ABVT39_015118 [Epinephelus coioides]